MAPGLGLKFLRDGRHAANIFAMYSLVGQANFNFFKHDLSSHVPDLPNDAPNSLQLVRWKFATASAFPVFIGNSDIAAIDENGKNATKISFPFRLHFHPNTTLHDALPDEWSGTDFEDQINKLINTAGLHLYDVYAQETPFSDSLVLIGKINSKNAATRSFFADKTLFYQHTRFESDLKTYPSWKDKAVDIMNEQRQTLGEGYHYPDLPFNK